MQKPWRSNNRFQVFPGSDCYVPELLSSIDSATDLIILEQYLVESGRFADRFIDALRNAANRGVKVFLLFDSYGSQGLEAMDRQRLDYPGIALAYFNPVSLPRLCRSITRDHRKLLLVDRKVAFTGGFCLTDEFLNCWYDLAIRIEGPVVEDWFDSFYRLWSSRLVCGAREWPLPLVLRNRSEVEHKTGKSEGRMTRTQGRRRPIRHSLQSHIEEARKRVWMYTPYFLPTRNLLRQLQASARRGVDVRIIVAGNNHDHPAVQYAGRSYYGRLLRAGVRVYEYQASFTHAKFCLADDWCTVGSCNFDHWSFRWNLEANQEVKDGAFAEDIAELYRSHLFECKSISLDTRSRQSVGQRLRQRVLGALSAAVKFLY
ncbi:phospholipase D-like domain-containing protein [Marinobacter fonticola]|uniref:phospholipase D-like domain-containing protein n=1 Tax=Marinobacter fonticola TaxID=2603215 RepID=UPI0011E87AB0|nr:phospholipase D-like domain-containing protein [Marinobacter fonticola]